MSILFILWLVELFKGGGANSADEAHSGDESDDSWRDGNLNQGVHADDAQQWPEIGAGHVPALLDRLVGGELLIKHEEGDEVESDIDPDAEREKEE
jgi:hypothetical protein